MRLQEVSRKHPRESDPEEFIPISKKLNNLHLDGNITTNQTFNGAAADQSANLVHKELNCDGHPGRGALESDRDTNNGHRLPPNYEPSLNPTQNPLYYEANRLLFEAHVSRSTRKTDSRQRTS